MRRRATALALAAAVAACGGTRDAERAGDAAYAAGRFGAAAAQYERALRAEAAPRVLAKLGQASLRAGEYGAAVAAWRRLGEEDASRRDEAADGLELVARAASRAGDAASARDAEAAIAALAPERGPLDAGADPMLRAMAEAGATRTVDSLLVAWAARAQDDGDCDAAVGAFRGAVRRADPSVVARARTGVAECATALGRQAFEGGRAAEAVAWFREALAADPEAAGDEAMAGLARAAAAEQDTTGGETAGDPGAQPPAAPTGANKE